MASLKIEFEKGGTFIALAQDWLLARFRAVFAAAAALSCSALFF